MPDAPSAYRLMEVMALAQATLDALRTDHGQILDTDDDILGALTEEGIDVGTILRRVVRAAMDAQANAVAVSERIDDLTFRLHRFERQEERWRNTALTIMGVLNLRRFADPEFTLSVRDGNPKVIITDANALADELFKAEVVRVPDKAAIKDRLDEGCIVAGAMLSNAAPYLVLKVR